MYLRPVSIASASSVTQASLQKTTQENRPSTPFATVLEKAATAVDQLDKEALQAQLDLVSGNARDMHTATLAVEKASLALDLVVSVRNKAIEAYQEIMRMPV